MPTLSVHYSVFVSDKTRRRGVLSGIRGVPATKVNSESGRLLQGATVTIAYTTRLILVLDNVVHLSVALGSGQAQALTPQKGFLTLPGPGTVVLTNPDGSKDADGGVSYQFVKD